MSALRTLWTHAKEQPFIVSTGLAALVHSTWSLGTLFSGQQPTHSAQTDAWLYALQVAAWLLPAFLIAFALDIGQIVTSHEIRIAVRTHQKLTRKYVVFSVFAIATYYLQWLYIAHHMPALPLAPGISALHAPLATALRDFAVWLVPALLPLSTFMYTFSHADGDDTHAPKERIHAVQRTETHEVTVERDVPMQTTTALRAPVMPALPHETHRTGASGGVRTGATDGAIALKDGVWNYVCPHCAQVGKGYATQDGATNALGAHIGRWCPVRKEQERAAVNGTLPAAGVVHPVSVNGHKE